MADINVSKTDYTISVNTTTNTVTVTPVNNVISVSSQSYAPVTSVNGKIGEVVLTTNDINESLVPTNLWFTTQRARQSFTAANSGGSGSLTYNSGTGVFTYNGVTDSQIRSKISASGDIVYDQNTGVVSYTTPTTIASLSNHNTDDLTEGVSNLYYTAERARTAYTGGTGVSVNATTGEISIGQQVNTTSNVVFNNGTFNGDLTVNGTATYINTQNLNVEDSIITLNYGQTGTPTLSSGIEVERGDQPNVSLIWNEGTNLWEFQGNAAVNSGEIVTQNTVANKAANISIDEASALTANPLRVSLLQETTTGYAQSRYDNAFTYDHINNVLTAGTFSGNLSGNATTATTANNVALTSDETVNGTRYLTFSDAVTGNENLRTDPNLNYNPNSKTLTANVFAGSLSGNATTATTATTATNANNVAVSTSELGGDGYVAIMAGTSGNQSMRVDTGLTYNMLNNRLTATTFAGSLNGNADTATLATTATTATNAVNVGVTNTTASATHYLTFVDNFTTGNRAVRADDQIRYNPGTNTLTVNTGTLIASTFTTETGGSVNASTVNINAGVQGASASQLKFLDNGGSVTVQSPTDIALDYTLTLPQNAGTSDQVLKTDGTGVLSWASATSLITDGRNLTYTGSTLDLDKSLVSVNSVAAEAATNFSATGNKIVLRTRVNSVDNDLLTLDSNGYLFGNTVTTPGSIGGSAVDAIITALGTTTDELYRYHWKGNIATGSNVITNCRIYSSSEFVVTTPLTWTSTIVNRVLGKPVLYGGGTSFPTMPSRFPLGARVLSVTIDPGDSTLATVTLEASDLAVDANATATTTGAVGMFAHYMRNSNSTLVCQYDNTILVNGAAVDNPGTIRVNGTVTAPNGYLPDQTVAYYSHSYTVAPTGQFTGRKIIYLGTKNSINEHINVPFSLGVGPNAITTNRGLPSDGFDALGISILNPGTINGYTGKTILGLTSFSDNSYLNSGTPADRVGGQLAFNWLRGNANSISNVYALNGDNLGRITWWSQAGTNLSYVSSDYTPASIHAKATEDHTGSATGSGSGAQANASGKHGTAMYLQYTPNSAGCARPRTFLMAEDKTLELRSVDSIVLKPVSKTGSNTTDRNLNATVNHTWLTASDYVLGAAASNLTSITYGTGAKVTVGITSASGNNGDVGLVLQRATGNTANFEFKLPTGSANTLELINNGNSSTVFSVNNDAITFTETVRNTTTTATTAVGTTYTPAATVSNYIELELTAGSGTTTINVDNLTQAGSGAHYAILVYNNSGSNIGQNELRVQSNGTTISEHTGLNNGSRAIFTVYCVGAYASCEFMTAA